MKEKSVSSPSFMQQFIHTGVYKRTQGRVTRQVTFATIFIIVGLGAIELFYSLKGWGAGNSLQYAIPLALFLIGAWAAYRVVNLSSFADFLIAVEAEMKKVSWPSKTELIRSSIVVIFVIFSLAIVLFAYDFIWRVFFQFLGVIA